MSFGHMIILGLAAIGAGVVLPGVWVWFALRKVRRTAKMERLNVKFNGERHYPHSMWG